MTTMTSTATEQTLIVGPSIKVERGLYCGRCEAPALVRVFRPRTGANTQGGAVTALLNGDLVSELRCDICVFLEDWHVVEHLCPCGDVAHLEAAWSMYEAIRRKVQRRPLARDPGGVLHLPDVRVQRGLSAEGNSSRARPALGAERPVQSVEGDPRPRTRGVLRTDRSTDRPPGLAVCPDRPVDSTGPVGSIPACPGAVQPGQT